MSVFLSKIFVFKCNLAILRLTPLLALLSLPLILTRLLCYLRREHPPQELLSPTIDALALSLFPIAWFFGFLYYTDVPSLAFVLATVAASLQDQHILAAAVSYNPLVLLPLLSRFASRIARPHQLYFQANQYYLGLVRLRV